MNSSNNTIILNGCIQEFKETNEIDLSEDELFEIFSTSQITKIFELSFEEIEQGVVDGGQDGGIDTFLILIDDNVISSEDQLSEFKFSPSTVINIFISQAKIEKTFKENTIDKLISSIPLLFNLELSEQGLLLRFNAGLVEKILTFRKVWEAAIRKGAKIRIEYFYACKANEIEISSAFKSKIQQIIDTTKGRVHGAEVNFTNYSSKELLELYYKSISSELDLNFKETPMPITYSSGQIGYIGISRLSDFLTFITDSEGQLRENIFESNVRHYQGDVDVNRQIQNTIINDYERDFWWLNNGITIIASKVRQIGKKLTLSDVQIVNGLQTSFTIAKHYQRRNDDDRSVLVKVIESRDKESIDKIISSTNRQNPVSPTLLRATEDTQRTIELYFYNKGYFYDRRKNFYKNQGKPASKIFSIQFTAQAVEAIKNFNPASARAKPTTLIKTDSTYNKIFNPNENFDIHLNCCLIVQQTTSFIKTKLAKENKSVAKNFTYHIARIVTSIVTSKAHYGPNELKSIDLSNIDEANLNTAYIILTELVASYQKDFPDQNTINISKSQKFVDVMNQKLRERFSHRV